MNREDIKEILEKEKERLTVELKELGVMNPRVRGDWITSQQVIPESDLNLVADHTEEFDEHRAILAELETKYNQVNKALSKLQAGSYGYCELCAQPIEKERLAALPSATTCLKHKDDNLPI